jgi:putative membrane protein
MWHTYDVGWGWWLLMMVGMVAFWGLVIYGIVVVARGAGASARPPSTPTEPPQLVLKRRLAAGEITVEEYEALRGVIDETPAHAPPEPVAR